MGNLIEGMESVDGEGKGGEGVDFDPAQDSEVGGNVSQRSLDTAFWWRKVLLSLELVWGDEVSMGYQRFIYWDDLLANIELASITHDWVKNPE